MVEISIDAPDRDVAEFHRVMGLLQTKLGKTPDKAVELGAVFVAKALQGSTRVAKKRRRVVQDSEIAEGYRTPNPMRWQAVYDKLPGQKKLIPIRGYYNSREEAQLRPEAKIAASGLARLLWWKAAAKIGQMAAAQPSAAAAAMKKADSLISVKIIRGMESQIRVDNSSKYALLAFKSSGTSMVDTAMRRAANMMRKYVERQSGDVITQQNMA